MDRPRLAAVVGWPVSHSLSPLIHATWAEREGVLARYEAIPVEPDDDAFARRIHALRDQGYRGCNVTVPHKERAFRLAATASAEAKMAGAANMLTFADGLIHADNSDIGGFAAAFDESARGVNRGAALVLGAGGAARAVLVALAERLGFERIVVANRTRSRAIETASVVAAETIAWERRSDLLAEVDAIVNATTLGMQGEPPLDLDLDALKNGAVVCDIVYTPLSTPLISDARRRGLPTIDGLSMLMHQAAPGYRAWIGKEAVVDNDLRLRLETALRARTQ